MVQRLCLRRSLPITSRFPPSLSWGFPYHACRRAEGTGADRVEPVTPPSLPPVRWSYGFRVRINFPARSAKAAEMEFSAGSRVAMGWP